VSAGSTGRAGAAGSTCQLRGVDLLERFWWQGAFYRVHMCVLQRLRGGVNVMHFGVHRRHRHAACRVQRVPSRIVIAINGDICSVEMDICELAAWWAVVPFVIARL